MVSVKGENIWNINLSLAENETMQNCDNNISHKFDETKLLVKSEFLSKTMILHKKILDSITKKPFEI